MIDYVYYGDFSESLDILMTLKLEYDKGRTKFIENISRCVLDNDLYFDAYFECLASAAKFSYNDYLEEYEVEKWFFSSDEMTEFYKLARKIGRIKGQTEKENTYINEAYDFSMDSLNFSSYSASGYLYTGTKHRYASSWVMYLTCDFCEHFALASAVTEIFEYYNNMVVKLRNDYANLTYVTELEEAA